MFPGEVLLGLAWPLVGLVAIVLMFVLAFKAISMGSNVKLEWKITEKVSGRVVITKARQSGRGRVAG